MFSFKVFLHTETRRRLVPYLGCWYVIFYLSALSEFLQGVSSISIPSLYLLVRIARVWLCWI